MGNDGKNIDKDCKLKRATDKRRDKRPRYLRKLELVGNELIDLEPLRCVTHLNLSDYMIYSVDPLAGLKNLTKLDLRGGADGPEQNRPPGSSRLGSTAGSVPTARSRISPDNVDS